MIKFLFIKIILFLIPFIIFVIYTYIFRRRKIILLSFKKIVILFIISMIIIGINIFYLSNLNKNDIYGVYIPAKIINGINIPAYIK